jgi:ATP synthase protein I
MNNNGDNNKNGQKTAGSRQDMEKLLQGKTGRKIRAQKRKSHSLWYGLGMLGLLGWAVGIPTLLGIVLGLWLDANYPGPYSWTLMMMLLGLALGCLNAWFWVKREEKIIEREQREDLDEEGEEDK